MRTDNRENSPQQANQTNIDLAQILFYRKVDALYQAIPSSAIATVLIALALVAVLWDVMPRTVLTGWVSLIAVLQLIRVASWFYYQRSETEQLQTQAQKWDRLFYGLMTLSAASWGYVSIGLLPTEQSIYHYFPALVLIGTSAGAVITLAFNMRNITTYYSVVLVPLFVHELLIGSFIAHATAALIVVFFVFSLSSAWRFNRIFSENIILQYQTAQQRDEVIQSRNAAEEANLAKSRFISMISHELRTPLNGILGFAQLLKMSDKPALNEEQQEQTDGIIDSGKHLLNLIEELLELSRMEATHIDVVVTEVDVKQVLDETLAIINPVAMENGITLHCNVEELPLVMADHKRLKQVVINLLSNAIKYGREHAAVTITTRLQDKQTLRLAVTDEGEGLTAEQQDIIFDPFQRFNETKEGLGLGLYICKKLVNLMGGTIGVESQPGHGSTFWIDLPLADSRQKTDADMI